jgi:hypothetical protein
MAKAAFNEEALFTSKLDCNLRKKPVECYIWGTTFVWCWNWTPWKVYQKYLESFEMWCWRRMEKINWTDRVRNEEVLQSVSGAVHSTYNKNKEGSLDWSHLA